MQLPFAGSTLDDGIGAKPSGPPIFDNRRETTVTFLGQIAGECVGKVLRCRPPDGGLLGLTLGSPFGWVPGMSYP